MSDDYEDSLGGIVGGLPQFAPQHVLDAIVAEKTVIAETAVRRLQGVVIDSGVVAEAGVNKLFAIIEADDGSKQRVTGLAFEQLPPVGQQIDLVLNDAIRVEVPPASSPEEAILRAASALSSSSADVVDARQPKLDVVEKTDPRPDNSLPAAKAPIDPAKTMPPVIQPVVSGDPASARPTVPTGKLSADASVLAGGLVNALGSSMNAAGVVLGGAGDALRGAVAVAGNVTGAARFVMPRLSDYRVNRVAKAVTEYNASVEEFWVSSSRLREVRQEMRRVSEEQGIPLPDIIAKMKDGGEFAVLRQKLDEAEKATPDAQSRRRDMDKKLDGFLRNFRDGALDAAGNGGSDDLRSKEQVARLGRLREDMEAAASNIPPARNENGDIEPSHFERIQQSIAAIMQHVKEFIGTVFKRDRESQTAVIP